MVSRLLRLGALLVGMATAHAQPAPVTPAPWSEGASPWFREWAQVAVRNLQRAQIEAEAQLGRARANHDAATEAYALLVLSMARSRENDMPASLQHSAAGLELARRLGEPGLLQAARHVRANALRARDQFPDAIEIYLENLQAAERANSRGWISAALDGLAVCYQGLGDKEQALRHAQQAFALAEGLEDTGTIGNLATTLADIHLDRGDFREARRYYTRALEARRTLRLPTPLADTQEALAMLDFRDGKPAEALAALEQVEAQRRTLRGKVKLTHVLLSRAEVLTSLRRLDEALACATEACRLWEPETPPGQISPLYHRMAAVREARGELAEALAASKRAFTADLALSGEAARLRAEELQARYNLAKKDEELARLARDAEVKAAEARALAARSERNAAELRATEAELSRAHLQRVALGVGIAAATVLFGGIVLAQRARLRAERRALTETQAARDAAEAADELKGRLLAFASHDLKAPLATLNVATHLIEASSNTTPEVRKLVATLRAETARMTHLVHDFLDRAALDAGRLELRPVPLDLAALVARTVADLRPSAEQKNQSLAITSPATALPPVNGEAARLEQVFANLIGNAIKYTPRGGTIAVSVGHDTTGVWAEVRDSGPGFTPQELASLFQPFARLSAKPTAGESSSGLGLHVARELVALHGGALQVDTVMGQGATFRVTLPAAA